MLNQKYQDDLRFIDSVDDFHYRFVRSHMRQVKLNYDYYKEAITFLPSGINEVIEALTTRWEDFKTNCDPIDKSKAGINFYSDIVSKQIDLNFDIWLGLTHKHKAVILELLSFGQSLMGIESNLVDFIKEALKVKVIASVPNLIDNLLINLDNYVQDEILVESFSMI